MKVKKLSILFKNQIPKNLFLQNDCFDLSTV